MRRIGLGWVGLALLAAGLPAVAEETPSALPPVLTACQVSAGPDLDGRGGDPAWVGSPMLTLEAQGEGAAVPVQIWACATDARLFLKVGWRDATRDDAATVDGSPHAVDRLRVEFAALAQPPVATRMRDPEKAAVVDATGAAPCGRAAWSDGGWLAEAWCGRGADATLAERTPASLDALRVLLEDGSGASRATPWVALRVAGSTHRCDFEQDEPGKAPAGMTSVLAGSGKPPSWVVRDRDGSRCLVQESADMTDSRFPLALLDGVRLQDVDLSVRFRAVDGFKDQGAGIVFRVKDAANHYILRANVLEQNVVVYKMQDNLRVDLPAKGREAEYGIGVAFDRQAWHVLRAVVRGGIFQAYLDGTLLFEVHDRAFGEPGGVGLWTKSDSVMAFDDLVAIDLGAQDTRPQEPR